MKEKNEAAIAAAINIEKEEKIVGTRGRTFQGVVIRKFPKRITIELERTVRIAKYERFMKKKTKIHARIYDKDVHDVHIGDLVKVQECRPLSKITNFIFIEKISRATTTEKNTVEVTKGVKK